MLHYFTGSEIMRNRRFTQYCGTPVIEMMAVSTLKMARKLEGHKSTAKDGAVITNAFAYRMRRLSDGKSCEMILNW